MGRSCLQLGACAILALASCAAGPMAERFDDSAYRPLFDGRSLAGWHVSALSSHSAASGHESGGDWRVEDGAIVGTQDRPGNGGILVSDERFGDVEIALEVRIDFGVDSGLFLRSSEAGAAYQATLDYYPGGSIAGLYGEALPGGLFIKNFEFEGDPTHIRELPAAFALPVKPEAWSGFWHVDGWNRIRARITGNPPHVIAWINEVRFLDFVDGEPRHAARGAIALQIHGGGNHVGEKARFRAIRVRPLD